MTVYFGEELLVIFFITHTSVTTNCVIWGEIEI